MGFSIIVKTLISGDIGFSKLYYPQNKQPGQKEEKSLASMRKKSKHIKRIYVEKMSFQIIFNQQNYRINNMNKKKRCLKKAFRNHG